MRIVTIFCLVVLILGAAACSGGSPSARPALQETDVAPVAPVAAPTATAAAAARETPAAIVPTAPLASPSETAEPATAEPAANDTPPATLTAPAPAPAAVLSWRLGGSKDADDPLFSVLGGLDVACERLYVADAYGGVFMFDLTGGAQGVISAGEIGYITDVKVGPDGTVYIADAGLHQITMFNADHELLGGFGIGGSGDGEFGANSPAALAVSPDGEVFVLDPNEDASGQPTMRVQVFSATGDFLRSFPAEPGPDAVGMDIGPDGTLFIVNRQGYVAEVEPEAGRLIARLGQEALAGAWPQAVAIDDAGDLYVTTQIPTAVAVLSAQGHGLVERIGGEGVRTDEGWPEGEFLFPYGIAVTPDGRRVFVGDTADPFAYVTAFERP